LNPNQKTEAGPVMLIQDAGGMDGDKDDNDTDGVQAREIRKKMRTPTEKACYFRRSMALTNMVSRILITGRDYRQSMALVTLILKRIRDMKQGATIVTLMTRILRKKNKFKRGV
jgi:hypothetical protein